MRRHRASVLGIGLLVSVSLAGCVGDSTKSASDTPASTPIASVGSETGPPVVAAPPPEAGEVQARGVAIALWKITNSGIGEDFAAWATMTYVDALTGDFNGDGRMDVALLRHSTGWLSMPVAFANADGTWRVTNGVIGDFASWAAEVNVIPLTGDFNGDGRTDVALVKRSAGWTTMPVAFANGDGSWSITNNSSGAFAGWAGTGVYSVQPFTGDFNGDGRMDVALLNQAFGWTTMPVAFANGDGSWRITNGVIGAFADWAATDGAVRLTGDFNGDGRTDVALVKRSSGWLSMPVAFANGDGSWRITNGVIGKDFARWAAQPTVQPLTGDFNGDGRTDVALLNQAAGWASMPVAFANGDGSWSITNSSSGAFAGFAATPGAVPLTGDFDGDGRTDVALLNQAAGWASMPVAFANGDGSWRILNSNSGGFAGWAATPGAVPLTGDFDGDKRTDVALLNRKAGWLSMPVAFWHDRFLPQQTIPKP